MLVTMRRVDIVVRAPAADRAMREVHRSGLVHLTPFEPPLDVGPGAFAGAPAEEGERRQRAALEQVNRLATVLGAPTRPGAAPVPGAPPGPGGPPAPVGPADPTIGPIDPGLLDPARLREAWELDDAELMGRVERLRPILARAERLADERGHVSAELARIEGYRRLVDALRHAVGRLPVVRGYAATGIIVGARHRAVIPIVRAELERLTDGRCEVIAADLDPDHAAAILLYPARDAPAVGTLLGGRELEELTLPAELQGIPFDQLGPRMAAGATALRDRLAALDRELAGLGRANAERIAVLRSVLGDRIAESRALADAGRSDHLVVIGGWVPAERLAGLRAGLAATLGDDVLVLERADGAVDRAAPVAMANGPLSRSFEPLARFVTVPRYGTIDPTPLLALTFPAFVGLMVGDVGYGLVILAVLAALRLWHDTPRARTLWAMGLPIAIATIAFGFLYGEAFGEAGSHALGLEPLWMDRRHAVMPLLLVALVIGVAQVGLGLALGVVNARRVGHRRQAVARAMLLAALLAVVALAAVAAGLLPGELAMVAAAAFLVAAITSVLAVGVAGPIELMGMLGHVLSYTRLMAIAMAGVMLALIADKLGSLVPGVVFGLLVALLIHALNLGLGLFDASIQGLRLHYVEFFSQFVEPGGTAYAPFTPTLQGAGVTAAGPPTPAEGGS